MEKKVWYFQLEVRDRSTSECVKGEMLKKLFEELLKDTAYDERKMVHSLKIKVDAQKGKDAILDIHHMEDEYLFGSLCSAKDHATAQKREMESLRPENIMDDAEVKKYNFELISYFAIHYKDSIISYIQTLGGPGISPLCNLINHKSFKQYTITTKSIVDLHVLEKVYASNYIDKLSFACAVPDVQCLKSFNISDKALMELENSNVKDITITITTKKNKFLKGKLLLGELVDRVRKGTSKKSKAKVKKNEEDEYYEYNLFNNKVCFVVKFEIDIHQTYDMIKKIIEEKIIETYEEEKIILNSMVSWD